jgi:hypothetical protein
MQPTFVSRFQFIAHALNGDGPFRPSVSVNGLNQATVSGASYLVSYPRESDAKFARRNEIAFYASPLARACSRFVGYLSMRPPVRDLPNPLYSTIAENVDGRGNSIDVFLRQFSVDAKARGAMLLLVDMPRETVSSLAEQLRMRAVPYWTAIKPENVTDYQVGDDGKFDFVEFTGNISTGEDGQRSPCTWRFDRSEWKACDKDGEALAEGQHALGECPVLIFTEGGDFPNFGPFAAIADLARRLFNLDSELDEILRAQTFSLLTMQVPDGSTDEQKLSAAKVAGETIGTSNLMVHSGSTPAFIAPPDGPARVYLDRIKSINQQIDEIGLNVATVNQQESGIAMSMRFQAINGELSAFSERMEDLERRAWDMSRRWLGLTQEPTIRWSRDYNLADVQIELGILSEMQATNMPREVIVEQQHRITAVQFAGLDVERQDAIAEAIDEQLMEPEMPANVVPLRPDPNAELRAAVVRTLEASGGSA